MNRNEPARQRSSSRRAVGAALACVAALGLSACQDAMSDPLAVMVAEETRAAVVLPEELPTLPSLVGRAGLEGELSESVQQWLRSWDHDGEEARDLRATAYRAVAAPLGTSLGLEVARGLHHDLTTALEATDALTGHVTPDLRRRLDRARELNARAARALEDGKAPLAIALGLQTSDVLREVGPREVAQTLIARADGALEGARRDGRSETDVDRGDRLVRGARLALEGEDWPRAIQRAYYACQVLGVSPY